MNYFKNILSNTFARRLFVLALFLGAIYLTRNLLTMYLLTFLFVFLINSAQDFLHNTISKFMPVKRVAIIVFLYVVFATLFSLLILLVYLYLPAIIKEITEIIGNVVYFFIHFDKRVSSDSTVAENVVSFLKSLDLQAYIKSGGKYILTGATNIGLLSLNAFMAFILSMFFMLQKDKVAQFLDRFKDSKISWFYDEMKFFGEKFTNSFGKVIQAQILIAFINAMLSMAALWIMHFPKLLGMVAMIFFLGLIPVAGVMISLIPLSVMAFNIGGLRYVIYILIWVAIIHGLETYILNPKLMSDKTKLPVFFTFLVLIISEHFLGIWGLIVGLPITMFLLDILEVNTNS